MKRVLLTGATGLIGRPLLSLLARKDIEVHAVSRHGSPICLGNRGNVFWHVSDVLYADQGRRLIKEVRPSHLVHLAWSAEPGTTHDEIHDSWLDASVSLANGFFECGGERMLGVGSCFEYDWKDGVCSEAATPLSGGSRYGIAKAKLCKYLENLGDTAGASCCWGRVFFVFGPGEHRARFVSSTIRSLLRGEPARCTHGKQVRDYLFSADVADALLCLLESGFRGACNIASGVPRTLAEIARAIVEHTGNEHLLMLGARAAPESEPPLILGDVSRLKKEIGWTPTHTFEDGIEETVSWWRGVLSRT